MNGGPATETPKRLLYRPNLIDPEEEAALLRLVEGLDFRELTMRGQTARCTVRLFGYDYDYEAGELQPGGAGIGWHRDAPMFGAKVIGVPLLSACRMRFQRRTKDTRLVYAAELEPRSAYVLGGSARWAWQHSIPPTKTLRYSITFRSLRER
jgi:alkylated DNA repair protein (DNA oxidative demethylase)